MANLFDYLNWRGDVPFSVDPFGEADGLLFAELAYVDWEEIPADERTVTVAEARDAFFRVHTREEVAASSSWGAKAALLLDEMAEGARFRDVRVGAYFHEVDSEEKIQISAVTFLPGDGSAYVAFRGTDNSLVGWREDFNLTYLTETGGQRLAVVYLNRAGRWFPQALRVGGHSKGGNFALYAAAGCESEVRERIREILAYDAPGYRQEVAESEAIAAVLPKLRRILPEGSIIGRLLTCVGPETVVESSGRGIGQHDAFTWEVMRNRFVRSVPTETSKVIDQVLDSWLEQMDDETRRSLLDTVFEMLEDTGQDNFHSMSVQKLKTAEALIASMAGLPKERRQELLSLVGKLVKSSGQTATQSAAAFLAAKFGGEKSSEENEEKEEEREEK